MGAKHIFEGQKKWKLKKLSYDTDTTVLLDLLLLSWGHYISINNMSVNNAGLRSQR